MSRDKQIDAIYEDLVEIFDEEYGKRNLITPQNTAEKLNAKGYRKASEIAEDIIRILQAAGINEHRYPVIAELKKKYTGEGK